MSPRTRLAVAGLLAAAVLAAAALAGFANLACPAELPGQPCPEAAFNRAFVIGLSSVVIGLLVVPFAFLGEFLARRRIVYRGAWGRATRRGLLAAGVVGAVAGFRIGGALTVPALLFVVVVAVAIEWFAVRRFDLP